MSNKNIKDSYEELERYDIILENQKNISSKGKKKSSERLSCQPVLSFKKKHENNNLIRTSNTRKKTTVEFLRNSDKDYFLSPLEHGKKNNVLSSKNIKTYNMDKIEEIINKKTNKRKSGLSTKTYNKNNNSKKKVYYQIKHDNLDIYERSMRNLERKEKYIQKQQILQLKKIYSDMSEPEIHEMSNVMKDYVPIYERALKLHNNHLMKIKLHEKKIELKKIEEENKDYEIVKQYANKKKFNEKDWENFLNKQYNAEYMKKMAEKLREQKVDYIPSIDYKSRQIILNKRKKELFIDDIHTRLYNDFNNMEERRMLRMSNSMPSFKPLLNKNLNKNVFNPKKKYNHVSSFDKQLIQLIDKKLKSLKNSNKNSKSQTKFTSQSFVNNTDFKSTNSKFMFNSKIFKNTYNNNKRSRYDENYTDSPIFISNNFVGNTINNKSQNLSNIESAKNLNLNNKYHKYRNIKNYKFRNKNINNNPYIYNKIIKEEY